jgi:hypothetical protein
MTQTAIISPGYAAFVGDLLSGPIWQQVVAKLESHNLPRVVAEFLQQPVGEIEGQS